VAVFPDVNRMKRTMLRWTFGLHPMLGEFMCSGRIFHISNSESVLCQIDLVLNMAKSGYLMYVCRP
jgi:hypothetical protein